MEYICEVHLFRIEISGEKLIGHANLFKDGESYFIEYNDQRIKVEQTSGREFRIQAEGYELIFARLEEEGIHFLH